LSEVTTGRLSPATAMESHIALMCTHCYVQLRRDIEYVIPKTTFVGETPGKEEQSIDVDVYAALIETCHRCC